MDKKTDDTKDMIVGEQSSSKRECKKMRVDRIVYTKHDHMESAQMIIRVKDYLDGMHERKATTMTTKLCNISLEMYHPGDESIPSLSDEMESGLVALDIKYILRDMLGIPPAEPPSGGYVLQEFRREVPRLKITYISKSDTFYVIIVGPYMGLHTLWEKRERYENLYRLLNDGFHSRDYYMSRSGMMHMKKRVYAVKAHLPAHFRGSSHSGVVYHFDTAEEAARREEELKKMDWRLRVWTDYEDEYYMVLE